MEEINVTKFKFACEKFLGTLDISSLRVYGRSLGLVRPTAMKKKDLIQEILKALCGESVPQRNNKGAPIKNQYLDNSILEKIEQLKRKYLWVTQAEATPETYKADEDEGQQQGNKPVFLLRMEEKSDEPVQFVIQFSRLRERQKKLFQNFLESL